jgi:hypothetical protein
MLAASRREFSSLSAASKQGLVPIERRASERAIVKELFLDLGRASAPPTIGSLMELAAIAPMPTNPIFKILRRDILLAS